MADLVVSGVGALTPMGANAAQTCASIRAGLSGLRRHPDFIPRLPDVVHEPPSTIACGFALDPDRADFGDRMLRLATAAVRDLVRSARLSRAEIETTRIALLLGGAERVPWTDGKEQQLARELTRRLGVTPSEPVRTVCGAPPAMFEMVREARPFLLERRLERALILAVDCLVDDASLRWLDQNDRASTTRNPDGFLPGEAGCCFLLESADTAARRKARALATVVDVGFGREKNTFATELNSSGEGLCEAIRAATRSLPNEPLEWVISDMNGESYWGYEWGLAKVRMAATLGASELWHPADSTGCIGVAAPALAVVLASTALVRGYAPSHRALLCCASDGAERGACLLTAAAPSQSGAE
jgi:3-oxoacyl-[acyl-carrier-protein] synthase-1